MGLDDHKWGLWSELPKGASPAWGARAILKNGKIELLWDRQTMTGNTVDRMEFGRYLNKRVLLAVHEKIGELYKSGALRGNQDKTHVLYDDDTCKVVGNTNASCGYIYLLAWRK
jgi:hypothetical protein